MGSEQQALAYIIEPTVQGTDNVILSGERPNNGCGIKDNCPQTALFEGDKCIWQRSYKIDEVGNDDDSAMARLVSIPVTFAVDMIAEGRAVHGVSTAPGDLDEIRLWLKQLDAEGVNVIEQESSDGHCW